MDPLLWAVLIGASTAVGVAGALALVASRAHESLFLLAGVASTAAAVVAVVLLEPLRHSLSLSLATTALVLAAVVLGFMLVSALLSNVRPPRALPPSLPDPGTPPRTLVILLVDTREREYQVASVTAEIAESVAQGFREPALAVLPFHYAAEKARYRAVGDTNPEAAAVSSLAERLASRLDEKTFAGPVVVRCGDEGALATTVEHAGHSGYATVVVAGVYTTETSRVLAQLHRLEERRDALGGVRIVWTRPLWAADELSAQVASTVLPLVDGSLTAGIALLVKGRREHTGVQWSETDEDRFADLVRTHLLESGLDNSRVRTGAVEWGEPGVTETVRHLAAYGSQRIVTVPLSYPFEGLETLFDIPAATRAARIGDGIRVVHGQAWASAEEVADLLAVAIHDAARGDAPLSGAGST